MTRFGLGKAAGLAIGAGLLAAALSDCGAPARAADPPLATSPDGRRLELSFSEDFSKFSTVCGGGGRWRTSYGDGSDDGVGRRTLPANAEQQVYVDPCFKLAGAGAPDTLPVRDGGLQITAEPASPDLARRLGHPYVSGVITTQPSFSQTYGYFEMKARLPSGKGLWPAFWLLPADQSWPPEIDVMESIGDPSTVYATVHSKLGAPPSVKVGVPGSPDDFHVFAVSWDPKTVIWFVDGREVARQPTPKDANKPMFMLINLAVGGHWPGDPDASTIFPAHFAVRYVRAYRFAS
jgi:beta-glucanase (GH16 family)